MTAIDTSGIDAISELKKNMDKRSLQVRKQTYYCQDICCFPGKHLHFFVVFFMVIQFLVARAGKFSWNSNGEASPVKNS